MKASIRVNSLTVNGSGDKSLPGMEKHGKRHDNTSAMRVTNPGAEPLVWGTLDLRSAYEAHVEGCRANKGLKRPVLHALVQFPKEIEATPEQQQWFLDAAVQFINKTHGGDAVFAARIDRDEAGRNAVDVFYTPKYEKVTKSRGKETWISPTKHGKELCHKHREEIERRLDEFATSPRAVGMALQSELAGFLKVHGLNVDRKKEKKHAASDWLSPEEYKIKAEMEKRLALEKQNETLKKGLAAVGKSLGTMQDLLPKPLQALLKALDRKYGGTSHSRQAGSSGPDLPARLDQGRTPRDPEPHPPAQPGP